LDLLQKKAREKYGAEYDLFKKWMTEKNAKNKTIHVENVEIIFSEILLF
jgi:hypothetical protein